MTVLIIIFTFVLQKFNTMIGFIENNLYFPYVIIDEVKHQRNRMEYKKYTDFIRSFGIDIFIKPHHLSLHKDNPPKFYDVETDTFYGDEEGINKYFC